MNFCCTLLTPDQRRARNQAFAERSMREKLATKTYFVIPGVRHTYTFKALARNNRIVGAVSRAFAASTFTASTVGQA